jgi:TatD DNase family protein
VKLFDSHLHLTDAAFAETRDETIARAREAGVVGMVSVASNPADARAAIDLAKSQEGIWATAGLHPHEAHDYSPDQLSSLRTLAGDPGVVAIGETGLDYYYDNSPRAEQEASFEAQLVLAAETGLPVVVHSRAADAETIRFLRAFEGRVLGVLHCFSGGPALLEAGLEAGWYVSFSGIVTFKKFEEQDLVRRVPADRLLIETDSPYLAPVPMRGKRNEPSLVRHTCSAVAAIRDEEPEEVARLTLENACRFYRVEVAE